MTILGKALTATAAGGSGATLTIPAAGAGSRNRIGFLEITLYSTAARTGVATPITVTSTNLNSLNWTFATAAAIGTSDTKTYMFPNPLDVTGQNMAATIVCPAVTGGLWRVNVVYWTEEI